MNRPRKVTPKELHRMSNVDVVLLATYLVGGALRAVDTEDIAVAAHKIDPTRFGWRKYPDQIDMERVRVRLSQARGDDKLAGVHSKGWRLTHAGTTYVRASLESRAKDGNEPLSAKKPSRRKVDRAWIAAERKRLAATNAFKKFLVGDAGAITKMELREFFRVDEYMSSEVVREKLDRLSAAFTGDKKIGPMVTSLSERIEDIFR